MTDRSNLTLVSDELSKRQDFVRGPVAMLSLTCRLGLRSAFHTSRIMNLNLLTFTLLGEEKFAIQPPIRR